MAKRVQISSDDATYYTLPGNSGQLNDEMGTVEDTIFGQDYKSEQPTLINAGFQANAFFKGFAGYVAKVKKSGSPTSYTAEPFTLVSGKTYKITDATKNLWNRAGSFTFTDGVTPIIAANIESIDYLFGRVTFVAGYTVVGAVTGAGSYLPLTQIAAANSYTLNQTADASESSDFETVQANGGIKTFDYGLKTVSLELGGFYSAANAFHTALVNRSEVMIEVNPDGSGKSTARGWFKPGARSQEGNVGDKETQSITFNLSVPDQSDVVVPFKWIHASDTTLNTGVQKALSAWTDNTKPYVKYLWDGVNGWKGQVVITSVTLTGALEAMNEFQINGQFSAGLTAVP